MIYTETVLSKTLQFNVVVQRSLCSLCALVALNHTKDEAGKDEADEEWAAILEEVIVLLGASRTRADKIYAKTFEVNNIEDEHS